MPAYVGAALALAKAVGSTKLAKALVTNAPTLIAAAKKNPQLATALRRVGAGVRTSQRQRIANQIALGREYAKAKLQQQQSPQLQAACRAWLSRLELNYFELRASDNQDRRTARANRDRLEPVVNATLAEIIETIAKWNAAG